MMESQIPFQLKCSNPKCGKTWTPRNVKGDSRVCPKCRSKVFEEVMPVEPDTAEVQPVEEAEVELETTSLNDPSPVEDEFRDDEDVKDLRKKLVMAELQQKIDAISPKIVDDDVLANLVYDFKCLLEALHRNTSLDLKTYATLFYKCPWCRENNMRREDTADNSLSLTCFTCGGTLP